MAVFTYLAIRKIRLHANSLEIIMVSNLSLKLIEEKQYETFPGIGYGDESRLRILLLDDDPIFNKLIKKTAKREGVAVNCQTEESKFFEQLYSSRYDIAVVDYFLEGNRKGTDLAMRISKIPVVLISESSKWAKHNEAWPYMVRAFLTKKIGIPNLIGSIIDIAEKHKRY